MMLNWKPEIGANEVIALLALMFSLTALILSWLSFKRESRVEKSSAYLDLETYSSQLFQYEATHAKAMEPFRREKRPRNFDIAKHANSAKITDQCYYQALNLFEVASNFRKKDIVDHAVFASWVAWFYEVANDWYFREQWPDMRENYTEDVRNIFDLGSAIFADEALAGIRQEAFFQAVALSIDTEGCTEIQNWLEKCKDDSQVKAWLAKAKARFIIAEIGR